MAFAFVFSSFFGLALHEWRGSSKFTKSLLMMALATLIYSTFLVGYSNFMNADAGNVTTKVVTAESDDGTSVSTLVSERVLTDEQAVKTRESIDASAREKEALEKEEMEVKDLLNKFYSQSSPDESPQETAE